MKYLIKELKVPIPSGVTVTIKSRVITVKGPKGELTKSFKHIKADLSVKDGHVEIFTYMTTYKQGAVLYTISKHIQNMIKGVTVGFRYKMHTVKKHFPIELAVKNGNVEVARFLGQRDVKVIKLLDGVKCQKNEKDGEELWFDGIDVDKVALNCAHVFQSCLPKDKDRRKFLDGVYTSEKGPIDK